MKINKKKIQGLLILTAFMFSLFSSAQSASEILEKMDEVMYASKDQKSVTTIVLTDRNGKTRERKAVMMQKGRHMRLTRFIAPASQAGIGFLSLPGEVMYVYLPAFKKERRIATHVKNQNFAGTDFTYEDMEAKPYSEKYIPELKETLSDQYVLVLKPKPDIRSDYAWLVLYVDKNNFYMKRVEYFNRAGIKAKELVSTFEQKQGYWTPVVMEMTDLKKQHKTRMIMTEISFDNNFSDEEFTVRKLKQ